MSSKVLWDQIGSDYYPSESSTQVEKLAKGLYTLKMDPISKSLFLSNTGKSFVFPDKIYGLESEFISRILTTYHNTSNNLGVLLTGLTGTGKTVSAKLIAEEMGLPVIIVNTNFESTINFIHSIQQDVIVFVDEFEKVYADEKNVNPGAKLLPLMDGVLKSEYRRIFVLTSNSLAINEFMKERPSRIRYIREFNRLSESAVEEIVKDRLDKTAFYEDLIKTLNSLATLTIDVAFTLVEEVNIHNQPASVLLQDFNAKKKRSSWQIVRKLIKKDGSLSVNEEVLGPYPSISPNKFDTSSIGAYFTHKDYKGNNYHGQIKEVLDSHTAIVEVTYEAQMSKSMIAERNAAKEKGKSDPDYDFEEEEDKFIEKYVYKIKEVLDSGEKNNFIVGYNFKMEDIAHW